MSTRAVIRVFDEHNKELCTVYKHYDGYPEAMLKDLEGFKKVTIINGIPLNPDTVYPEGWANGMKDLAAQIVCRLKEKHHDVYIIQTGTTESGPDYEYHFYFDDYDKTPRFEVVGV